jgi:phage major head subunit gpT-like protein
MIVNGANLKAISEGFSKVFTNQLKVTKGEFEKIATVVKSNTITQNYGWLGDFPKMREWVGDRVLSDMQAHTYSIERKKWESTVEVDREDIEYDNLGIVKPRIMQMAEDAVAHYDEITFPLLESNGICYDSKNFFAIDHPVGAAAFSNLGTKVLSQASFLEYRAEMRALTNAEGQPLRIVPNILIVPPELEQTAIEILVKENLANGETNITKGMCEYMVADWLTDATAWYLLDTRKVLKPIILQKLEDITFSAMDSEDDENVFMRDKFRYGTRSRDNAGYGLWQLAFKSSGTI